MSQKKKTAKTKPIQTKTKQNQPKTQTKKSKPKKHKQQKRQQRKEKAEQLWDECGGRRIQNTFKQIIRGFPAGFSSSCLPLSLVYRNRASDFNLSLCLKLKEAVLIHKASSFLIHSICGGQRYWDVSESLHRCSQKNLTEHNLTLPSSSGSSASHGFFMGWNVSHEISLKGEDYCMCRSV